MFGARITILDVPTIYREWPKRISNDIVSSTLASS